MNNKIIIDFKNLTHELKSNQLDLCFLKNRGLFIESKQGSLYQMETYRAGSYLNQLIKDGVKVEFNLVDTVRSKNIKDWEKERWDIPEVESFIRRHHLQ